MAINMGITRLATVSNYQCYPGISATCEGGEESSFYNEKQQLYDDDEDDYMHCDYYVADEHTAQSTSGEESSEAYSNSGDDDEDMEYEVDVDEQSECTEVKYYDRDEEIEIAASTEMLRIRFPFQSISIRLSDFCCLQEKDLLNDTIVDFYLNHIVEHVLPDEPNRRVTVLPSIFWHNLSISRFATNCDDDVAYRSMSERQKLDSRFGDLFDFVEDFELDVDYVIVPVNEWEHWSLVVVCHPFTDRARLLCFDSQLNHDLNDIETIANLIDGFLKYAWLRRTNTESTCELRCVVPRNLPQQSNNFDCGLFICEYTRRFLLAPPNNLDAFDFGREYADFSLANKRKEMQKAVLSLCPNKKMWLPIVELLN